MFQQPWIQERVINLFYFFLHFAALGQRATKDADVGGELEGRERGGGKREGAREGEKCDAHQQPSLRAAPGTTTSFVTLPKILLYMK